MKNQSRNIYKEVFFFFFLISSVSIFTFKLFFVLFEKYFVIAVIYASRSPQYFFKQLFIHQSL